MAVGGRQLFLFLEQMGRWGDLGFSIVDLGFAGMTGVLDFWNLGVYKQTVVSEQAVRRTVRAGSIWPGGYEMAWDAGNKKVETKKSTNTKIVELGGASGDMSEESAVKGKGARSLAGGMEMLELDFLLGVIENTDGADKNDVTMRKLTFNEVLRRGQQAEIDSKALTVYAVDASRFYGKDIQCAAMAELARRTSSKS